MVYYNKHNHKISTYKNKYLIHNLIIDRIGFIIALSKDLYTKNEINKVFLDLKLKLIDISDYEEVKNRLIKERIKEDD